MQNEAGDVGGKERITEITEERTQRIWVGGESGVGDGLAGVDLEGGGLGLWGLANTEILSQNRLRMTTGKAQNDDG